MLVRNNHKLINFILYSSIAILVCDIFTIITNIYIAPYLDGYGLPDLLIYIKAIVFIAIIIIILVWKKREDYHLTRSTLNLFVIMSFAITFFYFFSLYMYKYVILLDVNEIIRTKILEGNPALVFTFTAENYVKLKYITTIYGGFNSELWLVVELLFLQFSLIKVKALPVVAEDKVKYDNFLFDHILFPLSILFIIGSFTSINIFQDKYDFLESIMMIIGIAGFMFSIPSISASLSIFRQKNTPVTKTEFISWYRLLIIVSSFGIILFSVLFGLNIYLFIAQNIFTYRILTTLATLIIALIILVRSLKVISLENK
ncbi:MAG: hypothetical protein AB7U79_06740 [Candidatus Izemoplasmatales bacterium]